MKKTICALCSLLLCVLCIRPSFAAQGEYTLTLQMSGSAAVGEPLTVSLLLSVPEDNLDALWFDAPLNDCVKY